MKKCVIIGSGLGGLSTGVVLAKNGFDVTILEQAAQIGGCLQCFSRNGVKFETGMHFAGCLDDGQVLSNYFNYLEIKDKIVLKRLDTAAYNIVSLQGERFAFPNGREAFIDYFSQRFPSQHDNLVRYCDLVEQVACLSPYRSLQSVTDDRKIDGDLFFRSVDEVINETITDPLLREVLVGNISLYAAERGKTPFSTHAFIFDFYNQSSFRIVGGSDGIAKALAEVLSRYGGKIRTRCKASKILFDGKIAKGVETSTGEFFEADLVISDIHPQLLLQQVDSNVFTEAYRSRVSSMDNTTSVFSLFLRFKEGTIPYMNSNFYGFRTDSPWKMTGRVDGSWPQGYLYMHHCLDPNSEFAQNGVVLAYMDRDAVRQWDETTVGRRGDDYVAFKHQMAERLLDVVEKDFPDIRDHIESVNVATPLTYRDYTLTPDGSMYGLAKDITMGVAGRVSFKTKSPNLFLVGQNINSHGLLGVLVGSMSVCSHIVGEAEIRKQMIEANRKTVVVIGGGLGGLVTGALLAKENYKVTVLEKNAIIGGGLQCFKRKGIEFETGMHIFGGFNEGESMFKLFSYLGIMDKIALRPTDDDAFDVVTIEEDGATYRLPKGREKYVAYLASCFPDEKDNIKAFVDKIFELSEEEDLYYLREGELFNINHSDAFVMAFDKLIDAYISNPKLKALLTYTAPLFDGVRGETPAYMYALLNVLHINGTSQFVGHSQQMAEALKEVIEAAGGQVLANKEVAQVEVEDHKVAFVKTCDGEEFKADSYISDVHPDVLLRIIDPKAFPLSFKKRVQSIPESYSSFKVFVKFKDKSFPYFNHASYLIDNYNIKIDSAHALQDEWPHGLMFVTPPVEAQDEFARTMVVVCVMNYDWVKSWDGTRLGHRGEEYEQWKQTMLDQVIGKLEKHFPDFRNCIDFAFASSPLTIRDYYGNPRGSNFGFHKDCNDLMLSQMSVFTKVKNLYLTGQNVNIHGFCGVSLTAIQTAEALVGHNSIVRKINHNESIKSQKT